MVSESGPECAGAKVTEMEQLALAVSAVLHVLVVVKSPGLLPATTTEAMFKVPVPELVTAIMVGPLVAPWEIAGKLRGLGAIMTAGTAGAE